MIDLSCGYYVGEKKHESDVKADLDLWLDCNYDLTILYTGGRILYFYDFERVDVIWFYDGSSWD